MLLNNFYGNTIDWSGKAFCGLDLEWNYEQGYVDISIRHFVKYYYNDCNMLFLLNRNMHLTNGLCQNMAKIDNV